MELVTKHDILLLPHYHNFPALPEATFFSFRRLILTFVAVALKNTFMLLLLDLSQFFADLGQFFWETDS